MAPEYGRTDYGYTIFLTTLVAFRNDLWCYTNEEHQPLRYCTRSPVGRP